VSILHPTDPNLLVCNIGLLLIDIYERAEYFDLLGRAPYVHFETYKTKHCTNWTYNKRQLQNILVVCGYYCCSSCMLKCRRIHMTRIVAIFTTCKIVDGEDINIYAENYILPDADG